MNTSYSDERYVICLFSTDPDCVPLETLIALLGSSARWTYKILKPLDKVTQLDVDSIPFKSSWSLWVIEYALMKAHPELHSWFTKITEEFEDMSVNLNGADKKSAVLVIRNMFMEVYDSRTSYVDEESLLGDKNLVNNTLSAENNNSVPEIVTATSSSTIVPMKRKTINLDVSSAIAVKAIDIARPVNAQSNFDTTSILPIPSSNTMKTNEAIKNETNVAAFIEKSKDLISMKSRVEDKVVFSKKVKTEFLFTSNLTDGLPKRHNKGTRPRGCPCCDPDDIDNIIDKMLSLEAPP
jgi:hypothetical protein